MDALIGGVTGNVLFEEWDFFICLFTRTSSIEGRNIMDNTVLQYFKELHVPQVKDRLLQVTQDLAKNDDLLNQNLKLHYNDILTITENVSNLYVDLQDTDTHFRQFCFDDAKYQLRKLPDFIQDSQLNDKVKDNSKYDSDIMQVDNHNNKNNKNNKNNNTNQNDIEILLLVSQWSLSVSKFISTKIKSFSSISNDTTSHMDNTFFNSTIETLFENFDRLIDEKPRDVSFTDPTFKYFKSINGKIVCLQRHLIENSNMINLSHLQWIRFYNLINTKSTDILPWDVDMVSRLNDIIMDKIITLVLSVNGKFKDNEIISSFIDSSEFNQRLITYLKDKIQQNLTTLKDIIQSTTNGEVRGNMQINKNQKFSLVEYHDINSLIQNAKLTSLGLTNERRQEIYDLVEPIIQMIQNLIDYNRDHESLKSLQNELIDILKGQCLSHITVSNSSTTKNNDMISNTTTLINNYVDSYHEDSFIHLIQSQINRLQSLL